MQVQGTLVYGGRRYYPNVRAAPSGWQPHASKAYDRRVSIRWKGKLYRAVARPALLVSRDAGQLGQEHRMQVLRDVHAAVHEWSISKDRIRSDYIRERYGVADIRGKVREHRLQ